MRFLAVDLGDKRTGLAVGDDETRLSQPVGVIEASGDELLTRLVRALDEYTPHVVVIGLPLNMDGTEGPRARNARAIGAALEERAKVEVVYQDERLTSAQADWTMSQSGLTHAQKKRRRDTLAAAALLHDYLEARARGESSRDESS